MCLNAKSINRSSIHVCTSRLRHLAVNGECHNNIEKLLEIKTYQDDWELSGVVEVSEIFAVDCPVFCSTVLLHHRFHHQSLTDCQRSEKMRSTAAAATNQLSWWSALIHRCYKVQIVKRKTLQSVRTTRRYRGSWNRLIAFKICPCVYPIDLVP